MTTADLSIWFARPYPTVRDWLEGREPWGPNGQEAYRRLVILENVILGKDMFPVPVELKPKERCEHMKAARHEHIGSRISGMGASK